MDRSMNANVRKLQAINRHGFSQKISEYKKHPFSLLTYLLVCLAALLTVGVLLSLIGYVLVRGIPALDLEMFSLEYTSDNQSMLPAIINTLTVVIVTLLFAVPIGVFSAIYLTEYAKRGSRLVKIVRMTTETLSGIPSIVYGLFGAIFFNGVLGWGYSLLSGVCTLSIMILPVIMRTTEESLFAVPDTFREGSYGLGAGRLRTVFKIVLPTAAPGILSGIILSVGRIIGETAALIYTAGTVTGIAESVMDPGRTLAIHMYAQTNEGWYEEQAFATAVVLLAFSLLMNALSGLLVKKLANKEMK